MFSNGLRILVRFTQLSSTLVQEGEKVAEIRSTTEIS